jgi:two-component system response regulator NreC
MPAHLRLASVRTRSADRLIRVVLVEDHAAVRRNLRALLDGEADFEVITEASDPSTVVRNMRGRSPHVLVLDLGLSGGPSVETIGRLRTQLPDTHVVVLTMDDEPVFARHALDAGAFGFVLKEMADADLAAAVRSAARGERYVSPRMSARLNSLEGPSRTTG